jgi:hypothetical protein
MHRPKHALPPLTLLALVTLLTACSVAPKSLPPSAPIPPVIQPPQTPPLPAEARQPPTPALCSPSCSEGLRKRLQSLLP